MDAEHREQIRREVSRVRLLELTVQTLTERQAHLIERVTNLERAVGQPAWKRSRTRSRRKTA